MEYLQANGSSISTHDLATKVGINPKNIGRYLKELEAEGKINRKTIQKGKVRTVYISLRPVDIKSPTDFQSLRPVISGPLIKKESLPVKKISIPTPTIQVETEFSKNSESYNKSVELNALKVLYANRYGTTTNMTKAEMRRGLINMWQKKEVKNYGK